MAKADLTLDDARRALTYNPETGDLLWTPEERSRRKREVAGTVDDKGYVVIRLCGKLRLGHRLAWLLHYGKWPSEFVDHINGARADNRIANLRDVPHAVNMRNRTGNRIMVGAVLAANGKWRAAVHQYGGSDDLGREFDTPEEANAAWAEAKKWVVDPNARRPKLRRPVRNASNESLSD